MNALNDPNSLIHDEERYNRLKKQQYKNIIQDIQDRKFQCAFPTDSKQSIIINKIATKTITLEEGAKALNIPIEILVIKLKQVKNKDLVLGITEVLKENGYATSNNKKPLSSFSSGVQEEIVLMALTFRLSETSVGEIIHRTKEEVHELFRNPQFESYRHALNELYLETVEETEELKNYSYNLGKCYWERRKELIKGKISAQKGNNLELVEDLKKQLQEHRTKIDDTIIKRAKKKKFSELTMEEQDALAYSILKYYFPKNEAERRLNFNVVHLNICIKNLLAKDPFYAEKMKRYLKKNAIANPFWEATDESFLSKGSR